jgi:mannonate dehydratase
MKIGLVVTPFNEMNLQLAAQIGAEEIVYYNMNGMPSTVEELLATKRSAERHGLDMTIVEGGPLMDQIVVPKRGRDAQIEQFQQCLVNMGRAGFKVLCYSFMPWGLRVARTSYETPVRGGALASSFDLSQWDDTRRTEEGETTPDAMWASFTSFLRAVLPTAEKAGVKLALHPDDPPLPRLWGLARIFNTVEDFSRLAEIEPSPYNGITFCQGTFAEMEADIPSTIRRFKDRIHFVHFRDVRGGRTSFVETFHDDGKTDMFQAMQVYKEIGFRGVMRPDHVPLLAGEPDPPELVLGPGYKVGRATGYSMWGRLFAVGYMRGLIEAVRKTG